MKQLLSVRLVGIIFIGGVLAFESSSQIAISYIGTALAEERTFAHKSNGSADRLTEKLLTFCETSSTAATFNYQQVRDQLTTYAYNQTALDEIEGALIREAPICSRSGDVELVVDLMRYVGDNWTRYGKLDRADSAYKTAYKYAAIDTNNILEEISVLQSWASLKVQLNDAVAAKKLAALQSSVARRAYSSHKFGPELLVSALRFEITILSSLGDTQDATTREAEVNVILATAKKCVGLCKWD